MDYAHEPNRSRGVSSVLSPYHIPSNFPNIVSPSPMRGASFHNGPDFKNGGFSMRKISTSYNGDEDSQKKLNEMIAQSFKNWDTKPKRKETDDIDFSGNDNPILNLLNKSANHNSANPLHVLSNSIMSPDYKPRSFSISSGNWALVPNGSDKKKQSGWEVGSNGNLPYSIKNESNNGENRLIKVSTFKRINECKPPPVRTSAMLDAPRTIKQASPSMFPKFSAAFKPFKKRSLSVSDPCSLKINGGDPLKKRDHKED
jgi:hypothetical protein